MLLVFMLGFVGYRRVCTGAPARATAGALSLLTLLFQVRRGVRAAASAVAVAFRFNTAPSSCENQFSVAARLRHFEIFCLYKRMRSKYQHRVLHLSRPECCSLSAPFQFISFRVVLESAFTGGLP